VKLLPRSPAKLKVEEINQVALVVRDVEQVAENYWNILGIGPWDVYSWEAPLVYKRRYYGRPAWAREKIAITQVGSIMLELVQPIEGESIYQDFLAEHGEGLHHLNFFVDDVDQVAGILTNEGFVSLQSGSFGPVELKGAYNYIDIKPLHAIWEPTHIGESIGAQPIRCPYKSQTSPAKVKVERIDQVAFVVRDICQTVQDYWNILGIGPWDIYSWEAPLVYDFTYHGRPTWSRLKLATTTLGNVMLKLCQPVEGNNIYRDFLEHHGAGLHHLVSSVDDIDFAIETLAQDGFPSLQSGCFGSPECGYSFHHVDMKPLRAILEIAHYDLSNINVEPLRYPP
jgi:catechol 2,3-dioxygenase-like lactoylglutathione lyase family enzyme